jgi:hypothetical protein
MYEGIVLDVTTDKKKKKMHFVHFFLSIPKGQLILKANFLVII